MPDLRTLLAAVLGIGLGVLFVLRPAVVIRMHRVGRIPDHRGEYGAKSAAPERWRRIVQALGLAALAAGVYFGITAFP